jgi:hypothetical protein
MEIAIRARARIALYSSGPKSGGEKNLKKFYPKELTNFLKWIKSESQSFI